MSEHIEQVQNEALAAVQSAGTMEELNQVRIAYLGKKGSIQALMAEMKNLPKEEKPAFGQKVNACKQAVTEALEKRQEALKEAALGTQLEKEKIDITLAGDRLETGTIHPLIMIQQEIEDLFIGMGYKIAEGPEVEQDYYNFELANIPKDHPARDMQDTFYIDPNTLLRTHTTAMQMRELEKAHGQLPIKLICPGKVYRRDDDDATHSHQFMQCEGLVVGEHITLADLKGTLEFMANRMFGEGRQIRFRPSYFPFTEPSVEVDVSCPFCNGKGCSVCKGSGWIEILGAGMVHPHVLEMNGFDPKKCSGFAFGVGLERVAMLKYGIDDIRSFYTNDLRFLKTFDRFD
ncbi:phenylalanine--tRNA ligase subunit alpha [Erysipelotrichaceae bacterium Oil+RF-744-GAM-WT-6]|jgi:phenylalanyl-tRNA synthetase alpha chain|uniref:Phenylalanine--tRNA ligase alpha subunit n=1 Tax=Stecheria intestinalis TaxID=2606630 RepID=A0A7X2TGQ2_9FIRM|nr:MULTISPECIES: phenylalanine--tRNA ligase subunit alpha [Erysipelotrichaceae]MCI2155328.1 phenylalanine--tRNA ligase subunit alpha [Solobacterium sp.]MDD5880362.1 phenylalanine--tRNA ligase subunit alpha [Stecheria intestinalis]MDY4682091.1 phenylalanine--tRNA ligase subunit alpha [Lachnospiraceae bacterium]MSS58731.1 phenylalanine--tRNA ligase subunit alpha [Stecheria intestinalis]